MSTSLSIEDAGNLRVADLKDELKNRGASTAGKKAELYSRLVEIIQQESANVDNKISTPSLEKDDCKVEDDSKEVEKFLELGAGKIEPASTLDPPELFSVPVESGSLVDDTVCLDADVGESDEAPGQVCRATPSNVRIDNFQRPLSTVALKEWLGQLCKCSIHDSDIWVNPIKTHCYVTLPSADLATVCVQQVSGQRFPPTAMRILEADFTSVSAVDAPNSEEALLLPGEWKRDSFGFRETGSRKRKMVPESLDAGEAISGDVALGGIEQGEREDKRQRVVNIESVSGGIESSGGVNMFKRATSATTPAVSVSGPCVFSEVPRKTRAMPMISWMPAPGSIVEKRLKAKLMKA